jgi:hypothetical protein
MKNLILFIACLTAFTVKGNAQDKPATEQYGHTLNIGVGVGYSGYYGNSSPVLSLNYEFDVAKNFTLAPFIGFSSYHNYYYWGNPNKPNWDPSYRQYSYRETAVPLGVKGTYYFDQLLNAGSKWDFYGAGSIGFVLRTVVWDADYYGDKNVYKSGSPLYLDLHIGTEYHINTKVGLFLDLSTGVSSFGLAVHM